MRVNLKQILDEKEKSLYWLSDKTNVSYQSLHPLMTNKTQSIKFEILEKICIALNVTPSDILKIELTEQVNQNQTNNENNNKIYPYPNNQIIIKK